MATYTNLSTQKLPPSPAARTKPQPIQIIAESSDGERRAVEEGEFRSSLNKLLLVRKGNKIEILCARSKQIYSFEIQADASSATTALPSS